MQVKDKLLGLSRPRLPTRPIIAMLADLAMMPPLLWSAHCLKTGHLQIALKDVPAYIAIVMIGLPIFVRLGLYRAVIRFLGHQAVFAVAYAIAASATLLIALGALVKLPLLSPSTVLIYSSLLMLYVGGSRFLVRYYLATRQQRPTVARIAIYGAGEAGARLSSVLLGTRALDPVAFVDDKSALQGRLVNGIPVYGPEQLPALIKTYSIGRVLLALPTSSRPRRREILARLEPLGVHVQTVPELEQLVAGHASLGDIREVDVSDLLGRECVPPRSELFDVCIRDRAVMVTGAGGSIGSELCRQIINLAPKRLVLYELSEIALYNVERELKAFTERHSISIELVALLGNAQHKGRLRDILQAYGIQTIYHAAAYKHVPIVEQNVIEGMYNNLTATWNVAEAAHETGVETFVLISTDKAVNPANVLGATKRFAEILLQGLQRRGTATRFCMVRFGNVLASSGSVVPLFSEQIKAGGPVTVTHPEVIRYFMTIPEAAQLVIQAGSMAEGGDVFVLDMGKPVRIGDLARRMIHLMGLSVRDQQHPDGDIEIAYTGLRPAEKLFEELLIGNNVTGTKHPMIMRAIEHSLPWPRVQEYLQLLHTAMEQYDCPRCLQLLSEAVEEYNRAPNSHDLVYIRQSKNAVDDRKIAVLKPRRLAKYSDSPDTLSHH